MNPLPDELHTHRFIGLTTYVSGHNHVFSGVTSANPDTPGHVHTMRGGTTYDAGHDHAYGLTTGPAVDVGTGHLHNFAAETSTAAIPNVHSHAMRGRTSIFIEPIR